MVPYNEELSRIDEFWKLSAVKHGHLPTLASPLTTQEAVAESWETGCTDSMPKASGREGGYNRNEGTETKMHLMVVWFDILLLDDESLIQCKWSRNVTQSMSMAECFGSISRFIPRTATTLRRDHHCH